MKSWVSRTDWKRSAGCRGIELAFPHGSGRSRIKRVHRTVVLFEGARTACRVNSSYSGEIQIEEGHARGIVDFFDRHLKNKGDHELFN